MIVTRLGVKVTKAAVTAHSRNHPVGLKAPMEVYVLTELPQNPSGKVLKWLILNQLDREKRGA